jgi:hypothetical protein
MSEHHWKQGRSDAARGLGPTNKSNSPWWERQSYNAGYKSGKK